MTLLTTSLPYLSGQSIQPVSGRSWVRLPFGAQKILYLSNSPENASPLFTLYPSHQSIYHLKQNQILLNSSFCITFLLIYCMVYKCFHACENSTYTFFFSGGHPGFSFHLQHFTFKVYNQHTVGKKCVKRTKLVKDQQVLLT